MMHPNNPLEQDIVNLFKNSRIHVNDMREFFAKNVCEILDDDTTPTKHYEAALDAFDRWYRDLRKTLWTNGSKYTLTKLTNNPEKSEKTANALYARAFHNIDRHRRKEVTQ